MFHMWSCVASFVQACLASRYIYMHASDMPPKVGRVNLQLHICMKALWYHNRIPFENQLIMHAAVRVCQCWSMLLLRPSYETSL